MEINESTENSEGSEVEDGHEKKCISELIQNVSTIKKLFRIHGKVGEGTFSSVFLATLKSSNENPSKKFAIKYLVPTCHPERIKRELQCLQEIGGSDHVVGLELCLRDSGSVVFVMPYMRHDKFSEYVYDMNTEELKDYMRALLTALRRVHKFNIIHRDVKPNNFLYDRRNRRYLLVDFGLAQQYNPENKPTTPKPLSQLESQSVKRKRSNENIVAKESQNSSKNVKKCYCFGKPKICSICLTRPAQTAPRAGTPGFRAPEVLLKHPFQTPAIDIWACGVIMLCILSGTQAFFRSPDDCTALAEITSIFGSTRMQQCARKIGKKLLMSESIQGIDLVSLCQKLQRRAMKSSEQEQESSNTKFPMEAYNLAIRLLDLDYRSRITANEALHHPFLK